MTRGSSATMGNDDDRTRPLQRWRRRLQQPAPFHDAATRTLSAGLILLWLLIVSVSLSRHEFWRDEVRALSVALQPTTVLGLPAVLRNEGHPLVWYLVLRGLHSVFRSPVVLPLAAMLIGAGASCVFYTRSRLPLWQKILFVFSVLPLYEYTVMARNYGIGMLFLFLFAASYEHRRRHPVLLALLLVLLVNTSVHACLLGIPLCAFWLWDERHWFLANCRQRLLLLTVFAFFVAGGLLAYWISRPNSAKPTMLAALAPSRLWQPILSSLVLPGKAYRHLFPYIPVGIRTGMILGLTALLWRRPAAAILFYLGAVMQAALIIGVFRAGIRHEGLLLVLFLALRWISADADMPKHRAANWLCRGEQRMGPALIGGLLMLHIAMGGYLIGQDLRFARSSSEALGHWLTAAPALRHAIIIPEPGYMVEALPYYARDVQIYLPREDVFRGYVSFTTASQKDCQLIDLLATAEQLAASREEPVLIVLGGLQLAAKGGGRPRRRGTLRLSWTAEELALFRSRTRLLKSFDGSLSGEDFDVYRFVGSGH